MILTLTMNPSIDYLYSTQHFELGHTNKMNNATSSIGGKGINAGRAAATMDSTVILTGILCGSSGKIIKEKLYNENKFILDFIEKDEQNNRNAISIVHDDNTHTEITEKGPIINETDKILITNKIINILNTNNINIICISGSVNSNNDNFYSDIIESIQKKFPDLKIILDISGKQLTNVLNNKKIKIYMNKPNIHEFNEINNFKCKNKNDVLNTIKNKNLFNNIEISIISCGSEGAIVKHENNIYDISIPKIEVINPTGAGDSSIGGFASSIEKNNNIIEAIKYSMACGISNTKNKEVGKIDKKDVENLSNKIKIKKIT